MIKPTDLIGKPAPNFTAPANGNKKLSLDKYKGKKIVLYFYPKDMTPGCTTEAKDFACLYDEFKKNNCVIIGVSKDSPEKHDKFIDKYDLPFDLISDDENASICKSYGIWEPKKFLGKEFLGIVRSTFIIDEKGIVVDAISPVKVANHAEIILEKIK